MLRGGRVIKDSWKAFASGPEAFATPAVTNLQAVSFAQLVVVIGILLGFDLDSETQQLVAGLSALAAAVLPASDTLIRRARINNVTALSTAKQGTAAQASPNTEAPASGAAADGVPASGDGASGGSVPDSTTAPTASVSSPPLTAAERALLIEGLKRLR